MKKPSNAKVSSSATPQEPAPPGRLNGETLIAAITSMTDDNDHIACVNAWLDPAERRLPPAGLVSALDRGFAALWQRANQTLADVTLIAITDRVLHTAAEGYPFLSHLHVDETGLRSQALHEHVGAVKREELAAGIRFVLTEFLTVLGNLTANILTPALYSELSQTALPEALSEDAQPGPAPQYSASDKRDWGTAE